MALFSRCDFKNLLSRGVKWRFLLTANLPRVVLSNQHKERQAIKILPNYVIANLAGFSRLLCVLDSAANLQAKLDYSPDITVQMSCFYKEILDNLIYDSRRTQS